jgi:hypothetical protein
VDNLIDLLVDPWHTVRANWEDHARFLFHEYTGVHRVLQEATFANDDGSSSSRCFASWRVIDICRILDGIAGVECTDTVLVEIKRSAAADCLRRPLRAFQRVDDKGTGPQESDNRASAPGGGNANTNKEPVVEAMNRKQFMDCLHAINPAITTQEVRGRLS